MKSYKRVASAVLGMAMAASCMAPITAFAAEDFQQPTDNTVIANHPNDETMLHSTPVYRIGTKSFYKVNDDGSVTYADQANKKPQLANKLGQLSVLFCEAGVFRLGDQLNKALGGACIVQRLNQITAAEQIHQPCQYL